MFELNLQTVARVLRKTAPHDLRFSGISVDSRLTMPRHLFFALKGQKADGHAFLEDAARHGAAAAVVSVAYNGPDFGMALVYVEDPLQALQDLAKSFLASSGAKIVAVTGSLGKTTTKDFIAHLLSSKYRTGSSPGNSNSQIGLPLTIMNHLRGNEEVVVIEMGMTHPGNIKNLVEIAPPDIAVVTTIAPVHLVNFTGLDEIAKAKAEIFSSLHTTMGIFHRGCPGQELLRSAGPCAKLTFGLKDPGADYTMFEKDGALLAAPNGALTVRLNPLKVPGKHNLHNYLAALTVARSLGVCWEDIRELSETLKLPEKRLQMILRNGVLFVNDSYNAAVMSVKAALDSLPNPKENGRKIAVLGSMLELGQLTEPSHLDVAEYALDKVDIMLCVGEECAPIQDCWQKAGRPVFYAKDRAEIVDKLRKTIQPDDVVLLKGSRGTGIWKVLDEL